MNPKIQDRDLPSLTQAIFYQEIWNALKIVGPEKALDSDGLNANFYTEPTGKLLAPQLLTWFIISSILSNYVNPLTTQELF